MTIDQREGEAVKKANRFPPKPIRTQVSSCRSLLTHFLREIKNKYNYSGGEDDVEFDRLVRGGDEDAEVPFDDEEEEGEDLMANLERYAQTPLLTF